MTNSMEIRNKIISYVKSQIGINLETYRTDFTKQWERDNEIIIEFREMKKTDFRKLELLAQSKNSHIRIESVGVWGKMLAYV